MARKATKAKRPPSPYNMCMSTALKGKGGSKEQIQANFKAASAQCKNESKKPTYSANPITVRCAYCGKIGTKKEFLDVDEIGLDMDEEELEFIYDHLTKQISNKPPYTHQTRRGDSVVNICSKCFSDAQKRYYNDSGDNDEGDDDDDEGLGLERGASDDEDSTDDRVLEELDDADIPDAFYERFPDGKAYYDKTNKAVVIDSRGMGEQIIATYQGRPIEYYEAYAALRDEVRKK